MKKRLHLLFHRPVFQLGGLAILVVVLGSLLVLANLERRQAHRAAQPIAASEAATIVKNGQARSLEVQVDRAFLKTDTAEFVFIKDRETSVSQMLAGLGVGSAELATVTYTVSEVSPVPWGEMIPILAITLLLGGVLLVAVRRNGNGAAFKFGRSRARQFVGEAQQVTFDDVAGAAEAKEELMEIVEFLKAPEKFTAMGARIPKGVLLIGPPGTGKTLISRAVAGEAGAPFFSIAGSEFVEMFVGVGASRVRDLFAGEAPGAEHHLHRRN